MRTRALALSFLLGALVWAAPVTSFGQEAGEKKEPPAAEAKEKKPAEKETKDKKEAVELGKVVVTAKKEKPHYVQDVIPPEEVSGHGDPRASRGSSRTSPGCSSAGGHWRGATAARSGYGAWRNRAR